MRLRRALAVMRIVAKMAARCRAAIVVAAHDGQIIQTFRRIHHIRDGRRMQEPGQGRGLRDEDAARS